MGKIDKGTNLRKSSFYIKRKCVIYNFWIDNKKSHYPSGVRRSPILHGANQG